MTHRKQRHNRHREPETIAPARLMAVLAASIVSVAVGAHTPKLMLGIIVEGLRHEQLDALRSSMGNDGFNRLLNQGVVIENVDFGPGLDAPAAAAVLMTGASPSANGISGARVYDIAAHRWRSVVDDGKTVGQYTDRNYSPAALRVTTLSDEARIAGAGVTYSHAVACNPELAVILAGHASNSAAWLDDRTANWSGSTAYPDFPNSLVQRNRLQPLASRLDTMVWTPLPASAQESLPAHLVKYPFRHTFMRSNPDRVDAFGVSPKGNSEVTRIATEYITQGALGTHNGTDVLNVAYSLTPYPYSKTAENRYETADSYLRLDRDIAALISSAEQRAGAGNVLVVLSGTPQPTTRRRDDDRWHLPHSEFSSRKAISLLNLYLIALHGNGEWVRAYADRSFYLNAELAKLRDVDMRTLRTETADFLKRMAGVETAYTVDEALAGTAPVDDAQALRRNTVAQHSGDVTVITLPGCEIVDDYNNPATKSGYCTAAVPGTAPVYILAPGTAPQTIGRTVDARAVAPTVARQLHIRSPNAAVLAPLRLN